MSHYVQRVSIIELLDGRFGTDPEQFLPAYEQALSQLQERDLAALADEHVDAESADHFRDHWLNGGWWGKSVPIGDALRDGLIDALQRARDARLPVGAIWVTGASETFETAVIEGTHQVTLVLLTPRHPDEGAAGTRS
jgi:hypothetical protein